MIEIEANLAPPLGELAFAKQMTEGVNIEKGVQKHEEH